MASRNQIKTKQFLFVAHKIKYLIFFQLNLKLVKKIFQSKEKIHMKLKTNKQTVFASEKRYKFSSIKWISTFLKILVFTMLEKGR